MHGAKSTTAEHSPTETCAIMQFWRTSGSVLNFDWLRTSSGTEKSSNWSHYKLLSYDSNCCWTMGLQTGNSQLTDFLISPHRADCSPSDTPYSVLGIQQDISPGYSTWSLNSLASQIFFWNSSFRDTADHTRQSWLLLNTFLKVFNTAGGGGGVTLDKFG